MFGEMGEDDHQTMHGVRGVRLSDVLLIRGLGKWKLKTMKTINFDSGFCESRKGDGGHLSSLAFYAREQIISIPFTTRVEGFVLSPPPPLEICRFDLSYTYELKLDG